MQKLRVLTYGWLNKQLLQTVLILPPLLLSISLRNLNISIRNPPIIVIIIAYEKIKYVLICPIKLIKNRLKFLAKTCKIF